MLNKIFEHHMRGAHALPHEVFALIYIYIYIYIYIHINLGHNKELCVKYWKNTRLYHIKNICSRKLMDLLHLQLITWTL